jgi:SAM-dependent methyltransferase
VDQALYWNQVAGKKRFTLPLRLEVLETLLPGKDRAILDYGCGYGRILRELREAGYTKLSGMDFAPRMLEEARRFLSGTDDPDKAARPGKAGVSPEPEAAVELILAGGNAIPAAASSFDAVILMALLTCITGDDELAALINEAGRVLKPGGILYVGDFLLNRDPRSLRRYGEGEKTFGIYGAFSLPEGAAVRHFEESFIRTHLAAPRNKPLFAERYFAEESCVTMNGNPSRGFTWLGVRL